MAGAEFEVATRNGIRGLRVSGELDLATAEAFRDALHTLIEQSHSPAPVFLAEVSFMDSSCIGILVAAWHTARDSDVEVIVAAPSSPVRKVLELTGIDNLIQIADAEG